MTLQQTEFRNENTIKGVDACVKSHESKIFPYNEATYFCLRKHEIYLRSVDEWKDFTLKLRIAGKEEAFFELSIENPYVDAVITGADITLVFPESASAVDASSYNLKVGGFPRKLLYIDEKGTLSFSLQGLSRELLDAKWDFRVKNIKGLSIED